MSVLVIGTVEQAAIAAALQRARKRPIPFDVLSASAIDQTTDVVTLEERRKHGGDFHRPKSEQVMLPVGYRLAISYEEQPAGLCLHLSLSIDKPNKLPDPRALEMVVRACGIDLKNPPPHRNWVEEFSLDGKLGGVAWNVLYVVEPGAGLQ
jgi:hypothetical protein